MGRPITGTPPRAKRYIGMLPPREGMRTGVWPTAAVRIAVAFFANGSSIDVREGGYPAPHATRTTRRWAIRVARSGVSRTMKKACAVMGRSTFSLTLSGVSLGTRRKSIEALASVLMVFDDDA